MIQKFTVSRDDSIYQAWPDLALARSGKLICIYSECTHHGDRGYTRIMLTDSTDRGRTWSPPRPLTDALRGDPGKDPYWNCARITTLSDGRLAAVADRIAGTNEGADGERSNWLWLSGDEGITWQGPIATPVHGIVPDQLIELKQGRHKGRWILSAHTRIKASPRNLSREHCWISDDRGESWQGPRVIAESDELRLCEGSIVELPEGELVCFMRENSGRGLDAFKSISRDGGMTWEGPIGFPLPGCHRPVAGMLASGHVLITHRYMQGGQGWLGWWTQNFFAGWTDVQSCLASAREQAHARILPIDYDRSNQSDTGYSGWVQFPDDGEIYIVNYLVDDAPKAWIRGYALRESEIILPG